MRRETPGLLLGEAIEPAAWIVAMLVVTCILGARRAAAARPPVRR